MADPNIIQAIAASGQTAAIGLSSGTVADWFVASGTIILAFVALCQQWIHERFYRPVFRVSSKTAPPDCVWAPIHDRNSGTFVSDAVYLRLFIENIGNATAKNVEVFAKSLRRVRGDGTLEPLSRFPPMNFVWANLDSIYFPHIAPGMGKHCNVAHISDPAHQMDLGEKSTSMTVGPSTHQTRLVFELMVKPSNRSHIFGPGKYSLEIMVAADNARPITRIVIIVLRGQWAPSEEQMLGDEVGISVQDSYK